MRYYGNEAVSLVETLGMLPAIMAADQMLKAADVELISYENVGSTLVTVIVREMLRHVMQLLQQELQQQVK